MQKEQSLVNNLFLRLYDIKVLSCYEIACTEKKTSALDNYLDWINLVAILYVEIINFFNYPTNLFNLLKAQFSFHLTKSIIPFFFPRINFYFIFISIRRNKNRLVYKLIYILLLMNKRYELNKFKYILLLVTLFNNNAKSSNSIKNWLLI